MNEILGIVIVCAVIALLIFFRKKFVAILLDIIVGILVYVAIIFFIAFIGLKLPIGIEEWALPIVVIGIIAYHIITNFSTSKSKVWGAL